MMNLAQLLSRSASQHREKPAVILEGRTYSFGDIDKAVGRYAAWLKATGVQKGDRIAIQLPKSIEFVFIYLAGLSLGAIALPLNPAYTPGEVQYYLSDSGSSLFISDSERFQRLHPTLQAMEGLQIALLDAEGPDGSAPLPETVAAIDASDLREYPAKDDDVAVICYTSGTTGRPKGAMITHRNMVSNMMALKAVWAWTDRDRLLHVLPLFHVHGLMVALQGALNAGSTVIMHEKFDPKRTWETIGQEGITMLMGVPTIYHRLLNEREGLKAGLKAVRVFISGSAPLSENLFLRFEEATGYRILERYGMTEAQMITSNPFDPKRRIPKSVGYPLPGVQIRVVSAEGDDVCPGDVGEVWIKGDNVFKGYWQMPEKTAEALEEGWLKSGDLAYQDPEDAFRLYLVGRAKELIISGGYNVYPKEIEGVLEQHEAVHEVAVFGLPDEDLGERVSAAVVLKPDGPRVAPEDLIAFSRVHLTGYKCPKQAFFLEELPKNAMGKVQKSELQKQFSRPFP